MNAITTLNPAFSAPAAAAFQGMEAGDDLSGGITGGYGMLRYRGKVWAIHYRDTEQQLMRADGDGAMGSVEMVILKANPHLSKTWYEAGWDESSTNPPDCASANGVTPDQGVPKKQSNACATCPRNQWGTAPNGGKGKACSDHRRLAIVPSADIPNESFGGPMLLRCPAASLQDLASFDAKYKQAGYPYFSMVVKVAFDTKESYPKFIFSAVRPLNEQEAQLVLQMRNSDAVARVIADQMPVQQIAGPATPQGTLFEQAPNTAPVAAAIAQQQAPAVAAPAQAVQAQAAPAAPNPQVQPVTQAQPVASGFGGVAQAVQQPVATPATGPAQAPQTAVQQPVQAPQTAPQRPAQQMTGFGGTVAAAPQQPAQAPQTAPQPAAAPAVAPSVAFTASLDERLNSLLGN